MTRIRILILTICLTSIVAPPLEQAMAAGFANGDTFVGTLSQGSTDNQILRILPDGTTSVFADNITGGIVALEFDATYKYLYALTAYETLVRSRRVLRFAPDGTSEVFADLSQIALAASVGDSDLEIDANNRVFVLTAPVRLIELHGGLDASLRYQGPSSTFYSSMEIGNSGEFYISAWGGDVIRLNPDFSNPTLHAHLPLSHPQTNIQAMDTDSLGNLIALAQDFSSMSNLYRISPEGSVQPVARTENQNGKIAIGHQDNVFAVTGPIVAVLRPQGNVIDEIPLTRQMDGIAIVVVPEPCTLAGLSLLACCLTAASCRPRGRR